MHTAVVARVKQTTNRVCVAGKALADQIGTSREESKASRIRFVGLGFWRGLFNVQCYLRRAKEAVAAKTKAEDELRALALQLDTAVARARECEDKERRAEDVAARLKVR